MLKLCNGSAKVLQRYAKVLLRLAKVLLKQATPKRYLRAQRLRMFRCRLVLQYQAVPKRV